MKRYCKIIYIFIMAVLVLSLSGCDWFDDDDENTKRKSSTNDKLMVITSPALKQDERYLIYRGDKVRVTGTNARYYVAPLDNTSEPVTMNLLFDDVISEDLPFVITTADEDYAVVISYNPNGAYFSDITTEYESVIRSGGGTQKLHYGGLKVAGASVGASSLAFDTADETTIILDDKVALIVSGDDEVQIDEHDFVWHADPSHMDEYYTDGINGDEITEAYMLSKIFGVEEDDEDTDEDAEHSVKAYIAHDIRYMSSELNFEGLASADGKTEYVVYYSDAINNALGDELGAGFYGPYIFASLPDITIAAPEEEEEDDDEVEESWVRSALNNSNVNAFRTMTHTPDDAYNNPVLHIIEPGTYRLKGTWLGQIWLDPGKSNDITLILDGVNISCDVGPAIVFHNVRECEPSGYDTSFDVGYDLKYDAGAKLIIANKSTNNISGVNLYRIMKPEKSSDNVTIINGQNVSQQKNLYKMDGAIYSYVSLAIGAENNSGGGKLNVISTTYGGLCSDTHMLIDGGTITVSAVDNGIAVNGDDSVFTMNSGSLSITSKKANGIYSGSYILLKNGTIDITAAKDSDLLNAEVIGPLMAWIDVYLSDNVTYSHKAYQSDGEEEGGDDPENNGSGEDGTVKTMTKQPVTVRDTQGNALLKINYTTPVKDEESRDRGISKSSYIFLLERKVNSFSKITRETEE